MNGIQVSDQQELQYQKQAEKILDCVSQKNELVHWLWNQDYFTYETEQEEVLPLPKALVEKYLREAGATDREVQKVFAVIDREKM